MAHLKISKEASAHLSRVDPALGEFISARGLVRRAAYASAFECLAASVVAQQVSSAAAESVFARLAARAGRVEPRAVANLGLGGLRACGISQMKAECILQIALAALDGRLDFRAMKKMPDAQIDAALRAFKGVGGWTVEMLLIFGLGRADVFTKSDFGIRKGFAKIHDIAEFDAFKKLYSPHGTAASLYYWELAADKLR